MKNTVFVFLWTFAFIQVSAQPAATAQNVVLVTFDGYRWQELFGGAEETLMNSSKNISAEQLPRIKKQYWREDETERKHALNPFFWNTVAKNGVLAGNRKAGSKMQVRNPLRFSYPGYSEMFCGKVDKRINSNDYPDNPNPTIFDVLNVNPAFTGQMAAFATWDAFPRIINTKRNMVPVFVNFQKNGNAISSNGVSFAEWKTTVPVSNPLVSTDTLTYRFAKEYMQAYHPRVVFIGFDETDHFAHEGRYDAYLDAAHMLNAYMQDLWDFLQSDAFYKGKTTLIVTCDHGRGRGTDMWRHHGKGVVVAKETWLAAIGPGIPPSGELKGGKYYQQQLAATVAKLFGVSMEGVAAPFDFVK